MDLNRTIYRTHWFCGRFSRRPRRRRCPCILPFCVRIPFFGPCERPSCRLRSSIFAKDSFGKIPVRTACIPPGFPGPSAFPGCRFSFSGHRKRRYRRRCCAETPYRLYSCPFRCKDKIRVDTPTRYVSHPRSTHSHAGHALSMGCIVPGPCSVSCLLFLFSPGVNRLSVRHLHGAIIAGGAGPPLSGFCQVVAAGHNAESPVVKAGRAVIGHPDPPLSPRSRCR